MEYDVTPVKVPGGTDLLALARAGGLSWKEFHDLNPAFRRQVSPPHMEATAYLPTDRADKMIAYLNEPGAQPYAGYIRYRVRSGDSWWRISRRYGVPINVLKSVNNTRSNTLRPGHYVMVPGHGSSRTVTASASSASSSAAKTRAIAAKRGNYVVRSGDTLWSIARAFNTTVSTLRKSNGLRSSRLKIGQKLYIPNTSDAATKQAVKEAEKVKAQLVQYKVRRGDNLYSISRKFGVKVSDLCHWNAISTKTTIYAGQRLKVYVQ
jgi:membrane-bound lytic murein transglycosylase D